MKYLTSSYYLEIKKKSLRVTNLKIKFFTFKLLTGSWKLKVTFRVTNSKSKNKKFYFELPNRRLFQFRVTKSKNYISSYELEVKKYQVTLGITNWKTEKTKCWSQMIVICWFFWISYVFFNQLKKKRHALSYQIIERAKIIVQGGLNACRINNRTVMDTRIGVKF